MELHTLKKQCVAMCRDHSDLCSDFNLISKHVMGVKEDINPFSNISDKQANKIVKLISKHIKGCPVQKLLGYSMFYNCYIPYSKHTLTPRLETELLVEKILENINHKRCRVLDLCSGSGCIGIAIAKARTDAEVTCADISSRAVKQCRSNAKLNGVKVEVVKTDMFDDITEKYDIIVCNPPYISRSEYKTLDKLVKNNDPKRALVAKENGLYYYKVLADQAKDYLNDNGKLFVEVGYNQGDEVSKLLLNNFNNIEVIKDYSNNDRIIVAGKNL